MSPMAATTIMSLPDELLHAIVEKAYSASHADRPPIQPVPGSVILTCKRFMVMCKLCRPAIRSIQYRSVAELVRTDSDATLCKVGRLVVDCVDSDNAFLTADKRALGDMKAAPNISAIKFKNYGNIPKEVFSLLLGWLHTVVHIELTDTATRPMGWRRGGEVKMGTVSLERMEIISRMTSLRSITFTNCSFIANLPQKMGSLPHLTALRIDLCNMPIRLPSTLPHLRSFEIFRESAQFIGIGECRMPNLRHLVAVGGYLSPADGEALSESQNLRSISFRNVDITAFIKVPNAVLIHTLELANCTSLDERELCRLLSGARNLRHLDISGFNRYTNLSYIETGGSLMDQIGRMTHLQSLVMQGWVALDYLPKQIGKIPELRKLDLSNCMDLLELPDELFTIATLRGLNITDCVNLSPRMESIRRRARPGMRIVTNHWPSTHLAMWPEAMSWIRNRI